MASFDARAFLDTNAFKYDLSVLPGLSGVKGILPEPSSAAIEAYHNFTLGVASSSISKLGPDSSAEQLLEALANKPEEEMTKIRKQSFDVTVKLCSGKFEGCRPISRAELEKLRGFGRVYDSFQAELIKEFCSGPKGVSASKPSLDLLKGGAPSVSSGASSA